MRIEVVTRLKRQATKILADYQLMVARMKILEGIAEGAQAIRDGRTMDMSRAKEKLSKWLK